MAEVRKRKREDLESAVSSPQACCQDKQMNSKRSRSDEGPSSSSRLLSSQGSVSPGSVEASRRESNLNASSLLEETNERRKQQLDKLTSSLALNEGHKVGLGTTSESKKDSPRQCNKSCTDNLEDTSRRNADLNRIVEFTSETEQLLPGQIFPRNAVLASNLDTVDMEAVQALTYLKQSASPTKAGNQPKSARLLTETGTNLYTGSIKRKGFAKSKAGGLQKKKKQVQFQPVDNAAEERSDSGLAASPRRMVIDLQPTRKSARQAAQTGRVKPWSAMMKGKSKPVATEPACPPSSKKGTKKSKETRGRKKGRKGPSLDAGEIELAKEACVSLEKRLEENAAKNNLSVVNVKTILHHVITNEHVLAMVRNTMDEGWSTSQGSPSSPPGSRPVPYEPKMTRAKLKEVSEKAGNVPFMWPVSPIKKPKKKPQFTELTFSDNDDDDEDYRPSQEDLRKDESDYESATSICSPCPSTPRSSLNTSFLDETEDVVVDVQQQPHPHQADMQVVGALSDVPLPPSSPARAPHLRVAPIPMGPPPPRSRPEKIKDDVTFLMQLEAVNQELETYEDTIAHRTRSKFPIDIPVEEIEASFAPPDITADMFDECDVDDDWIHWLAGLQKTSTNDLEVSDVGDDDQNDPEYNFLADEEADDEEDFRDDRLVEISKKEMNQLLDELINAYENEDWAADFDMEHFDRPQQLTLSDMIAQRQGELQNDIMSKAKTVEPQQQQQQHSVTFNGDEKIQLQQQMQQHVQLLSQLFVLSRKEHFLEPHRNQAKLFLNELEMLADQSEATFAVQYTSVGILPPFIQQSAFRAVNLAAAVQITKEEFTVPHEDVANAASPSPEEVPIRRTRSLPPSEAAQKTIANSKVFMYPELLPLSSLAEQTKIKTMFEQSEDTLIVLGLMQFPITKDRQEQYQLICENMLPVKSTRQVKIRIKNMTSSHKKANVIMDWRKYGKSPTLKLPCKPIPPGTEVAPINHFDTYASKPEWLKQHATSIWLQVDTPSTSQSPAGPVKKPPVKHPVGSPPGPKGYPKLQPAPQWKHITPPQKARSKRRSKSFSKLEPSSSPQIASDGKLRVHTLPAKACPIAPKPPNYKQKPTRASPKQSVLVLQSSTPVAVTVAQAFSVPAPVFITQAPAAAAAADTNLNSRAVSPAATANKPNSSPRMSPSFSPGGITTSPSGISALQNFNVQQHFIRKSASPAAIADDQRRDGIGTETKSQIGSPPTNLESSSATPAAKTCLVPESSSPPAQSSPPSSDKDVAKVPPVSQNAAKSGTSSPPDFPSRPDDDEDERAGDSFTPYQDPPPPADITSRGSQEAVGHQNAGETTEGEMDEDVEKLSSMTTKMAAKRMKSKLRRDLESTVVLLDADIVAKDPKREEREMSFSRAYLYKVKERFSSEPEQYVQFLAIFHSFSECPELPADKLYEKICELLGDHPDLIEDFTAFLTPEVALKCGVLMENLEFAKARLLLRQVEVHFQKTPGQFQRVLSTIMQWGANEKRTTNELKDSILPLLKGQPHLEQEFSLLFHDDRPPDSYMTDYEEIIWDDDKDKQYDSMEEIVIPDSDDEISVTKSRVGRPPSRLATGIHAPTGLRAGNRLPGLLPKVALAKGKMPSILKKSPSRKKKSSPGSKSQAMDPWQELNAHLQYGTQGCKCNCHEKSQDSRVQRKVRHCAYCSAMVTRTELISSLRGLSIGNRRRAHQLLSQPPRPGTSDGSSSRSNRPARRTTGRGPKAVHWVAPEEQVSEEEEAGGGAAAQQRSAAVAHLSEICSNLADFLNENALLSEEDEEEDEGNDDDEDEEEEGVVRDEDKFLEVQEDDELQEDDDFEDMIEEEDKYEDDTEEDVVITSEDSHGLECTATCDGSVSPLLSQGSRESCTSERSSDSKQSFVPLVQAGPGSQTTLLGSGVIAKGNDSRANSPVTYDNDDRSTEDHMRELKACLAQEGTKQPDGPPCESTLVSSPTSLGESDGLLAETCKVSTDVLLSPRESNSESVNFQKDDCERFHRAKESEVTSRIQPPITTASTSTPSPRQSGSKKSIRRVTTTQPTHIPKERFGEGVEGLPIFGKFAAGTETADESGRFEGGSPVECIRVPSVSVNSQAGARSASSDTVEATPDDDSRTSSGGGASPQEGRQQSTDDHGERNKAGGTLLLLSAANVDRRLDGEVVAVWTMAADRLLLQRCRDSGATQAIFQEVAEQLGDKTSTQVATRFATLMKLFQSSASKSDVEDEDSDEEEDLGDSDAESDKDNDDENG